MFIGENSDKPTIFTHNLTHQPEKTMIKFLDISDFIVLSNINSETKQDHSIQTFLCPLRN